MILAFKDKLSQDLFEDRHTRETRKFSPELRRVARRKLLYLHDAAELKDLRVPPNNRLKELKGKLSGCHGIRINDQWRLVFKWSSGNAYEVRIVDYH